MNNTDMNKMINIVDKNMASFQSKLMSKVKDIKDTNERDQHIEDNAEKVFYEIVGIFDIEYQRLMYAKLLGGNKYTKPTAKHRVHVLKEELIFFLDLGFCSIIVSNMLKYLSLHSDVYCPEFNFMKESENKKDVLKEELELTIKKVLKIQENKKNDLSVKLQVWHLITFFIGTIVGIVVTLLVGFLS